MNLLPLTPPALARLAEHWEIFVPLEPQPRLIDARTWVWPDDGFDCLLAWGLNINPNVEDAASRFCPYPVGSTIGVQEIWSVPYCITEPKPHMIVEYLDPPDPVPPRPADWDGWRPAATMPAWAVRRWSIVRGVRLEREGGVWFWVLTVEKQA